MATIRAFYQVDSYMIDLNFYSRHFYDEVFLDNTYKVAFGQVYQDAYVINGYDHVDDLYLGLGGTGFGFDSRGYINRGTVQLIAETDEDGDPYWYFQNVSVSAYHVTAATLTASNADDRMVLAIMLAGSDRFTLSAYDDRFEGFDGNDEMFGQGGNDTLIGGRGHDLLDGGTGHDALRAGDGNDRMKGAAGNDVIEAGAGADTLEGGTGRDRLYGGSDTARDLFVFRSSTESLAGAQRDVICQFRHSIDDIDLSGIDAHTGRAGNQSFAFRTSAAEHAVWVVRQAEGVVVRGDVDGNRTADFEIFVDDVSRLSAGDFIL